MDGNSESIPLGPERSCNFISRSAVRRVRFSPRKDGAFVRGVFIRKQRFANSLQRAMDNSKFVHKVFLYEESRRSSA